MNYIYFALFCVFSILICIEDLKSYKFSLIFVFLGIAALFSFQLIFFRENFLYSVLGAFCSVFIFLVSWLIKKEKLGKGDIVFSFYCGFFSGFPGCFFMIFAAIIFGLLFFGAAKLFKKQVLKIPFTPFLSFSSIIIFLIKELFL